MGQIRGQTQSRRRRDARLDVAGAIECRLDAGLSYDKVAAALGAGKSAVWASLASVRSVIDPVVMDQRRRKRAVDRALRTALAALSR